MGGRGQNTRAYTQCCGAGMSAFGTGGAPGPQHIHFPRPRADVRPERVHPSVNIRTINSQHVYLLS